MAAKNAMEIFIALDKSNCRKCGEKTCLAFAGAVFTGQKSIDLCPSLSDEDKAILRVSGNTPIESNNDSSADEYFDLLKSKISGLDFLEAAERCGGTYDGQEWLSVKVLGKDVRVNKQGDISTDIHVNPWVMMPFLAYVVDGAGAQPLNRWISYREVKGGRERYDLFNKRCEEDLRGIADRYPDLFQYMVEIFQGSEVEPQFASDVSVVLLPLPKVPIMICYWGAEDGLESTLNVFLDSTVDENLGNDGIYTLCAGLTEMFTKLAGRHGFS